MSENCTIFFPCDARVGDIHTAMAILSGLPWAWKDLGGGRDPHQYVEAAGTKVNTFEHAPGMLELELRGPMVDGDEVHSATWHYQGDAGFHQLNCGNATPYWQALAMRLVDCFGGTVDFNDCDSSDIDYVAPHPGWDLLHRRNEDYVRMQRLLAELVPLTIEDLKAVANL